MIELDKEPFAPETDEAPSNQNALKSVFFTHSGATTEKPPHKFPSAETVLVVTLGVLLPSLVMAVTLTSNMYPACGVLLRHWVETLLQFSLLISVPAGIYFVWKKIQNNDLRRARLTGNIIGLSLGSAFLTAIITSVAVGLRYPTQETIGNGITPASTNVLMQGQSLSLDHSFEVTILSTVAWMATFTALFVAVKFRNLWSTRGARWTAALHIALGAGLALFTISATEARSACIRIAERLAIYGTPDQKKQGLSFLQGADCERTLRMDCSNARANGISEMFSQLDPSLNKKLYFLATGQPFRFDLQNTADFAALPDEMLGQQVVGEKISNLSMAHSLISGSVHPESLTSTIDWTFVFQNTGFTAQEARAEIALPKDAVVSDMVLWMNGVPKRASIGAMAQATQAYQWVTRGRRDPALVTDLGKGRVLVQCNPVPAQGEMKIKISMKSGMKMDQTGEAVLNLPTLIKSNFEVQGDHRLQLRSENKLKINLDNMREFTANNGLNIISGEFSSAHRTKESIDIRVKRDPKTAPIAVRDPLDGTYIVQHYTPVVSVKPDHLVVVVDGSSTMAAEKASIKAELTKLPKDLPTSLIVASADFPDRMQFEPLKKAINAMDKIEFKGGQDNLSAVVKAAELAGETEGGAVLWIHGPQPSLDNEMYIVAPYLVKPRFFEMSIEDSVTDVNEFFKNHQEIGPFTPLARNSSFDTDLHRFLDKWQTNGADYTLSYAKTKTQPAKVSNSVYVTDEVSRLFAAQRVRDMAKRGATQSATNLATAYGIVTPVTSAVVLELATDYQRYGLKEPSQTDGSESLLANMHPNTTPQISRPWHAPRIAHRAKTRGHGRFAAASPKAETAWQTDTANNQIQELTMAPAVDEVQSQPAPMAVTDSGTQSMAVTIADASPVPGASFGDSFSQQSVATATEGSSVPGLQGASNGTIGPQGGDATSIMGVNTAGTVRVNNLANLEAMLNLFANSTEVIGIAGGGILFLLGVFKNEFNVPGTSTGLTRSQRLVFGAALIVLGLITPGFMNFMVASARDANLFS